MNFHFLPDMGRMNGRLRSGERIGSSPALTRRPACRRHVQPDRTAKMNGVDPQAWLADVLARLPDHPANRLDELLPWNWRLPTSAISAQAA